MSQANSEFPRVVEEVASFVGHVVTTAGWIHRVRELGGLTFIVLRDGTGLLQIVHAPADGPIPALQPEMAVKVTGRVVDEPRAPGGIELRGAIFTVLGRPDGLLSLSLGAPALEAGLDSRLTHAALALRHPAAQHVFRVQARLAEAFRQGLSREHFIEVHTPKIIGTASESGANVFHLPYFGRSAYLAQSPQFYKQMMVGVFGRVFEVGPVFRAEPHDTGRHLSQYTSLDAEMGFIDGPEDVMAVLTRVMGAMLEAAQEAAGQESPLATMPGTIPVVHFEEALALLSDALGEDLTAEPDLAPAHERWLGEWARSQYGSDFLFVVGYPMAKRPFYTMPDLQRPGFSRSFDLLFRGQEIVTGGQRLHRFQDYEKAMMQRGLSMTGLEGYLSAFQYGMPPHGGFAIGLERLTAKLLGLANIREATLFPRDTKRLEP
ncbi:aspartate--tRNA(Asn) ligase [Sulfobacillus harzensis]|uniref:Aspartate--tRNA(Asp/Asn) ligase n=1 Tax=Sulfobacillus harzensis TaxID=2729629 RepID=A0A7Y0Q471_9FIRM|nr:aspartate--tRNA(Asn) ligase [Sulfobacillus harzensis]NMP24317.1 aspartate--tRNA(Asn) ligase [Sulfobacillus harzensis]